MIPSVRRLYIPVLLTILGAAGVGCADRTTRVVANPLPDETYIEPRDNSYDTRAWAKSMAERDARRAADIVRWKSELLARAHIDFFPPADKIFRERMREDAWSAADREMIRGYLSRILKTTEQRRAFEDDARLASDAAQARRILNYFNAYDAKPEV